MDDHTNPGGQPPAMPQIRVALAEDHAAMRRTLRRLLENEPDVEVIADAGDLETAIEVVQARQPQVLVLDLGMCNRGVETIRQLRERMPSTEIVIVTMHESQSFARHTLAAGAIGFVAKEIADAHLPQAVRQAVCQEEYVGPRPLQHALLEQSPPPRALSEQADQESQGR
jgi:DNA-binding NarL/FixJ family response regulator